MASMPHHLAIDEADTPLGRIAIACTDGCLVALEFADAGDRFARSLNRRFAAAERVTACDPLGVVASVARYFDGDLGAFDGLPIDPGGTVFQRRVWSALRRIPSGATRSYGALAAKLGQPAASRAVGLANGANPIAIVIPCHRLIGSDGGLTGYAGGVARKRWLLEHEGALPRDPAP